MYSEKLLQAAGLDPACLLEDHPTYTVAKVRVGDVRSTLGRDEAPLGLDVVHEPDADDNNPQRGHAHCVITGLPAGNNPRKKAKDRIAAACEIVILGDTPPRH